jgi:hypothetical protein
MWAFFPQSFRLGLARAERLLLSQNATRTRALAFM